MLFRSAGLMIFVTILYFVHIIHLNMTVQYSYTSVSAATGTGFSLVGSADSHFSLVDWSDSGR